jgi:hypothetical protein
MISQKVTFADLNAGDQNTTDMKFAQGPIELSNENFLDKEYRPLYTYT